MITKEQFQTALDTLNAYKTQCEEAYREEIADMPLFINETVDSYVLDTALSPRCFNILKYNGERLGVNLNSELKVGELSKVSELAFLKCRNAGMSSLRELRDLCFHSNINLLP
tara:strand:+ start:269 stop:607 length:339 start_codon:yes stop_codon:yes gene_type:complete